MDKSFPLASMETILRKAGAPRVSGSAKKALGEVLEDLGLEIAENAVRFAKHSGRKTVKASDVNLAAR